MMSKSCRTRAKAWRVLTARTAAAASSSVERKFGWMRGASTVDVFARTTEPDEVGLSWHAVMVNAEKGSSARKTPALDTLRAAAVHGPKCSCRSGRAGLSLLVLALSEASLFKVTLSSLLVQQWVTTECDRTKAAAGVGDIVSGPVRSSAYSATIFASPSTEFTRSLSVGVSDRKSARIWRWS